MFSYDDAETLYRSGKFGEAKLAFETYVGTKPENPWGHYMFGLAAWKTGDFKTAERAFDRAIALDSTGVKNYLGSARVLLDLKREPEAIERIHRALTLDSTSTEALRLLARATSQQGKVDSAIEIYRTVLARNDHDVWAMNNLGVLYLDQGQPESAIGPLGRAVELDATAPVFRNNLGMALERTGHFLTAKQAYEAAVKADPTYHKAVANRDRLAAMTIDSTESATGFVKDQADAFRLLIAMWRER
jgi:tetratricopeptide (TPR) repeat protein